jgi:hypothetical protein
MVKRQIDGSLKQVFDSAFSETFMEHFVTIEEEKLKAKIEAFRNSFLYYVAYLLDTGQFASK